MENRMKLNNPFAIRDENKSIWERANEEDIEINLLLEDYEISSRVSDKEWNKIKKDKKIIKCKCGKC